MKSVHRRDRFRERTRSAMLRPATESIASEPLERPIHQETPMRPNPVKTRLAEGGLVYGTMIFEFATQFRTTPPARHR